MSTPEDRPALVDQPMPPNGTWRAQLNAFMAWDPAEGDSVPLGPLLPQEHESGGYYPAAGNSMKWVPAVSDAPAGPVLEIVDVPGDEDQSDADVVDNVEQARS